MTHVQAHCQPTMPRAIAFQQEAEILLGPISLSSPFIFPSIPSLFLFSSSSLCQEVRPSRRSGERYEFGRKAFLYIFEARKCVGSNRFVFVGTKCASEVTEPKWATVQTTLCEESYYSGGHVGEQDTSSGGSCSFLSLL